MKNNSRKNDEEKVNETKSNISQNESHQPLNSDLQQNINFRILNANKGNLFQKGQKQEQQRPAKNNSNKQTNNSLQKRIPSNKEYKEDEKNQSSSFSNQNSNNNSSFQSSLISDKKSSNSQKKSSTIRSEEKKNNSKISKKSKSKSKVSKRSKASEASSNLSSSSVRNSKNTESKRSETHESKSKNSRSGSEDKSDKSSSKSDDSSSKSKSSDKSNSESNSDSKSSKSKSDSKSNSNSNTNRNENSKDKVSNKNEEDKKTEDNNGGEETEEEEEDEFEEDNNKVENEEKEHRKLFKREKICDTDTEDEESENEKEIPWIILPDNPYKKMWDLLIAFLILYSAIITPYDIAFSDTNKVSWFEILIDILLGIDIVLTFFSAYTDDEENLVKNHRKIIKKYLKSWFIIDIISVLPISYIFNPTGRYSGLTKISKLPKLYRLVKLTKLLRITKMSSKGNLNKVTKFFMEKLKINANVERLFFFVLTFLLMNHLCACFWYFMAKIEDFSPDSWVVRLGYIDSSNVELYIISFYWTLTTVTTVGYGDITAGTTIERIYNLFIMSFGVLLYSFAIGSLSSIVSTLDQKSEEMNQKLQILSSIKKEFNLEQNIYDKVRKVIKYDLSRNQKDKMVFLQELPNKLRIELSQIMHDKVIQNFYFFRDQPSDFFAYVAPLLKPVKFSQNDYLYKCQDMIDEMYFVAKGTVIFCLEKRYGEKEIREIKKNNNFGEIEMCLNEKLSFNIKIKSRNCELFVLKKNDFLRLSVNFKEFIESFLHKSLMKYLKFNEEKNKMMKEFDSLINADEAEEGEEENEDSEEEDEESEEEEENENEEKALESIDEEGGSSSEGGSENESENENDKDKSNNNDEESDKEKSKSNESENEKESKDSNEKSKSNDSEMSGSSSKSNSENKSNKKSESKENTNNNNNNDDEDEEDDSSYRVPEGNDIVKLNKVNED